MSRRPATINTTPSDESTVQPAERRSSNRSRFWLGLLAVLLLAALLRLWSIDFGVPMVTHPDEPNILNPALQMVHQRDLNPHWFVYPGLIIYVEVGIVAALRILQHAVTISAGTFTSLAYVGGRLVMALSSLGTVVLVGLIARRMTPRRGTLVGLLAAGILAVSFLHVKDSHYLKPDVPTAFFTALTLWFTLDALEHDRRRDWLLAAAAVGLAASAKYTGVAVALVPAIAFFMVAPRPRDWLRRWRTVAAMVVVALAVFLVFNPGLLLTPRHFYDDAIVYNQEHYQTGHEGAEGNDSWRWYLLELWHHGIGPTLSPLVIVGLLAEVVLLARGDRRALLLLVFPVLYYLDSSRYTVRFDRQLIPILPFLAVIGARWLGALPAPRVLGSTVARVALAFLAVALFSVPVAQAVAWDVDTGKTDTRYAVRDWAVANLPPGAVVAREWYTPPLAEYGYGDLYIRSAHEQPRDWYTAHHVDYLIVSSFMYQRYLDEPAMYPAQAAFYERLLARPALARFGPGGNLTGPVIYVFRLSEVLPVLDG